MCTGLDLLDGVFPGAEGDGDNLLIVWKNKNLVRIFMFSM